MTVELVKGELVGRVHTSETSFQNAALVGVERVQMERGEVKSFKFLFGRDRKALDLIRDAFPGIFPKTTSRLQASGIISMSSAWHTTLPTLVGR